MGPFCLKMRTFCMKNHINLLSVPVTLTRHLVQYHRCFSLSHFWTVMTLRTKEHFRDTHPPHFCCTNEAIFIQKLFNLLPPLNLQNWYPYYRLEFKICTNFWTVLHFLWGILPRWPLSKANYGAKNWNLIQVGDQSTLTSRLLMLPLSPDITVSTLTQNLDRIDIFEEASNQTWRKSGCRSVLLLSYLTYNVD